MGTKELKITAPEGYEIDRENSTLDKIVFKKIEDKVEKYDDVAKKLFSDKTFYFFDSRGDIDTSNISIFITDPTNSTTQEQLEWLRALNKLQNVANYLNDGWVPDWSDLKQEKYSLYFDGQKIAGDHSSYVIRSAVYFKNRELALKAIEILGEEVIKTALGVYRNC